MTGKKKPQDQRAKFMEAAREHGCDESEETFDDKLRVIAKQKPKGPEPKTRGKRTEVKDSHDRYANTIERERKR